MAVSFIVMQATLPSRTRVDQFKNALHPNLKYYNLKFVSEIFVESYITRNHPSNFAYKYDI